MDGKRKSSFQTDHVDCRYGKRRRESTPTGEEDDSDASMTKTNKPAGSSSTVDFTFADLQNYMNGEFLSTINRNMDNSIKALSDRIDQTQEELRTHKGQMQRELERMREELGSGQVSVPVTGGHSASNSYAVAAAAATTKKTSSAHRDGRFEAQYWHARRSSRFFPVMGESEDELRENLKNFCTDKLRIPSGDIQEADIEHVRRVRLRRGKESVGEIVVLFNNMETRDRITSYARNLGQFVDSKGKPTAGIRFEIPDHLSGVHRTLLQYGHALWNKYNKNPEFKRNVRFDDAEMSFCLDVKIPGKIDWLTVSYERARREKNVSTSKESNDDLLSLTGPGHVVNDGNGEQEMGVGSAGGSITLTSWRAPNKT